MIINSLFIRYKLYILDHIQLTSAQKGWRHWATCSWKSKYNPTVSPQYLMVSHPCIQPTADHIALQYIYTEKKSMYTIDFWTLWEKARVGCFKRTASKHYLGWNRSPAQVGCMRQGLGPGALGRLRGIGRRGRWEGGLGWGIHVKQWLILVNVWQKPLQYCKVISLQLIKKKKIKSISKKKNPCKCTCVV